MKISRRTFLQSAAVLSVFPLAGCVTPGRRATTLRRFHLCVSPKTVLGKPEVLETAGSAGVTDFWIASFMYGHWIYPVGEIRAAMQSVQARGWNAHLVNVPLGHPDFSLKAEGGNSLSVSSAVPSSPPNWPIGQRPDGRKYAGVSLHEPVTAENVAALRRLSGLQPDAVFLDDDFRLAPSPGDMGGCFCAAHRRRFLDRHGYAESKWMELLAAVDRRELTPRLKQWQEVVCDELSDSFRAQQRAIPQARLGIMVMYLGAEKAGIRLEDYRGCPFRVGELMFDDNSFARVKGKTDELFSALFHRRFTSPGNTYSETTAYPPERLSGAHLAAKLTVSTIAEVRHTMFMSGLDPFPIDRWLALSPAIAQQRRLHARVAGCRPRGPLKHYWGEWARRVGRDNPYSLFLAMWVPFEVVDRPTADGWVFLGDGDAKGLSHGEPNGGVARFVCRPDESEPRAGVRVIPETLEALFSFKREIVGNLSDVPFIAEDHPAVCAWYPRAGGVLVWNLAAEGRELTVRLGGRQRPVTLAGLGSEFVEIG